MKTPIYDFVRSYASSSALRLHMPGHKGKSHLGFEHLDITEFTGADSLYHADGIIKESEENATSLFDTAGTFYSTEGSSHCIRAMLHLAKLYGGDGCVLAGRNAHSSFISALALNSIDVEWIYPEEKDCYLSALITPEILEKALGSVSKKPICVYVTSPDYLGNMCDISGLAQVCEKHGTILAVDNAHGAYLKFLERDLHPISLGAHICCDSAHKTLPALTGGAYLHISKKAPDFFVENAKNALSLFGSTSPSYLTLSSLDKLNEYLAQGYKECLGTFLKALRALCESSEAVRVASVSSTAIREPMKIALETAKIGYRGEDFAKILEEQGVICEFYDSDYVVLMPSPENSLEELNSLFSVLNKIPIKKPLDAPSRALCRPARKMSPHDAVFAPRELISVDEALGRTLAVSCVSCPPAVSLIVCGEEFDRSTVDLCKKYGFDSFWVVK